MICLGIETSCDETALALVRDGKLLAQTLSSQIKLHSLFGGVVPELASREHYRFIGPLFDELLKRTQISATDIDCIAVARGPGLLGSLLVGVAFAKALALGLKRPLLGINHLHAHLLAAGLTAPLLYPALGLLVSGGHTQLYRIEAPDKFVLLGRTLDDAAGETYDKIGSQLGLPYPAGKEIDLLASSKNGENFPLPRPYLENDNLDFSFSGLKTAAITLLHQRKELGNWKEQALGEFCAAVNEAIAGTLRVKTERALERESDVKAIWVAGGVAANNSVRKTIAELAAITGKKFIAPEICYCTDNAAMIAYSGYLLRSSGYLHGLDFETVPRGRLIPQDMKVERQINHSYTTL